MLKRAVRLSTISRCAALASLMLAGIVLTMPESVSAGSPVSWSCNCAVPGNAASDHCTCSGYSYDIAKLGTKTFHGFCTGPDVTNDAGYELQPATKFVNVHRGKNVTCTIDAIGPSGSGSVGKSCTNWGTAHRNEVQMSIRCARYYGLH